MLSFAQRGTFIRREEKLLSDRVNDKSLSDNTINQTTTTASMSNKQNPDEKPTDVDGSGNLNVKISTSKTEFTSSSNVQRPVQTEIALDAERPDVNEGDFVLKNGETKGTATQQSARKKSSSSRQNKAQGPQKSPSTISNGTILEYRIKRLAFNLGYYSKVGLNLKTANDEEADTITDLDVYGVYVHKDFSVKTLWADCKSGGVRVHDRLLWIKGVMSAIEISDVLLVARGVRTSVKQYARRSGIQILDLKTIEKLEENLGIQFDDWRGSWNPDTQHNRIITLSRISIPTNDAFKKISAFLSSDYWVMDNYSRAKKTITALRDLSTIVTLSLDGEQLKTIKWAIFELTNLFLLALLNIAKEIYYFSDNEKKETLFDGLASGDLPNKKRVEIFNAAFKVAYSLVKNQIPDFEVPNKMPTLNLNPPNYSDAFYDLMFRITNKPMYFFDILRFMDFVLMEYDLDGRTHDEEILRPMFNNYDHVVVGAKTLLHFICNVSNIPKTIFTLLK